LLQFDNHIPRRSRDVLLDRNGQVLVVGPEDGHSVGFVVTRALVSQEKPYGIDYSLTLHGPEGERLGRRFVAEDAVCLDISANIGVTAMHLSRHAHSGRVIAIEAGEKNAQCLRTNITVNGLTNVEVLNAAIGDRTTEVKFSEHFAFGHISSDGVPVPMMTIDDLAARFSLDRIDFIKIDVEGYEYKILRSALNLVNRYGTLIYFELNSYCQVALSDTNPKEFMNWLRCSPTSTCITCSTSGPSAGDGGRPRAT
jgi:FkbM family methyltransferase